MWYILDCDEESFLYLGFKRDVTKGEVEDHIYSNSLTNLLNRMKVKIGECYFIPSGTTHAIGKGITILEVQQNLNLTYRLYDYGRINKNGKMCELHIKKALEVLNFRKFKLKKPRVEDLLFVLIFQYIRKTVRLNM